MFVDKEIFTDVTAGERHEADLVVRARFKREESFFLIHVESQAQYQAEFSRRMFRYFARLYEKHQLRIYPVVVFSYDRPQLPQPTAHRIEFRDLNFVVLEFRYQVIQLNQLDWRKFVRHENAVASAFMARMDIATKDRPRVKMECMRMLATLKLDPAKMKLIAGFVEAYLFVAYLFVAYLDLTASEVREYEAAVEALPRIESEAIMEVTISWIEQGKTIGREEGLQEGVRMALQQTATLVTRLIEQRIGVLDPTMEEGIRMLSMDKLTQLGEAIVSLNDAEALASWLANNA